MTGEDVYEIWHPASSTWSAWMKPVLFSFLSENELSCKPEMRVPEDWNIAFDAEAAVVIDLPGEDGVFTGIQLARAGYRPVPVYNACPFAANEAERSSAPPVVDMIPIMRELCKRSIRLAAFDLPGNAPPAFLLDSNRNGDGRPDYECFDNRSFITDRDFPSASFLRERGITKIILVQRGNEIGADLLNVLLAWQRQELRISSQPAQLHWEPQILIVKAPSLVSRLWRRMMFQFGYPGQVYGAFGQIVHPPAE